MVRFVPIVCSLVPYFTTKVTLSTKMCKFYAIILHTYGYFCAKSTIKRAFRAKHRPMFVQTTPPPSSRICKLAVNILFPMKIWPYRR